MTQSIAEGSKVSLNFALHHENGAVIDSTFGKNPAEFTVGDGNLLAGFEACLIGLKAGDHNTFVVVPENAFGQRNPDNLQTLKRSQFGPDMVLEPGLIVSFSDAANTELPGVVQSFEGDDVIVDFNHPLAGVDIKFEVEVISVA